MSIAAHEGAPVSPARLLVLVAIVVGVVAGAFACATGLTTGAAHAHGPVDIVASAPDAHSGHASHAAAERLDHGVHGIGTTERAPGDDDAGHAGHPGMSCVVEVDLRFRGGHSAVICDLVESSEAVALVQRADDLEPPVPRAS